MRLLGCQATEKAVEVAYVVYRRVRFSFESEGFDLGSCSIDNGIMLQASIDDPYNARTPETKADTQKQRQTPVMPSSL